MGSPASLSSSYIMRTWERLANGMSSASRRLQWSLTAGRKASKSGVTAVYTASNCFMQLYSALRMLKRCQAVSDVFSHWLKAAWNCIQTPNTAQGCL
eukprot:7702586-Alexandrium_andersonii.AAC.1